MRSELRQSGYSDLRNLLIRIKSFNVISFLIIFDSKANRCGKQINAKI